MIDINTYRSRIGQFSQRISSRKYLYRREFYYKNCWNENPAGKNALSAIKIILKIILITVVVVVREMMSLKRIKRRIRTNENPANLPLKELIS